MVQATSYDAARPDGRNKQHWTSADALDANLSNSLSVRTTLIKRSRYETGNNGNGAGIVLTQSNYVVGRGPKLRMQTGSAGFNAMIEAAWERWWKAVAGARKLRTAVKAKVRDGETFLIARTNPRLPDEVKIDLVGIEAEQCTSHYSGAAEEYHVDGIQFDEFGNPEYYEILRHHPGGDWATYNEQPERIPAKFVFHLQREDRFGAARAVPELTPSLNTFAGGRRFREAVLAAAENIANFSIILQTQAPPDNGPTKMRPFDTLPMEKGMMVGAPMGWDAFQPKAEQPSANYDTFTRSQTCESARPLNMPYNIAAADSSGYSFSGGRLDHLTYFVSVDVEQADLEDMGLDPLFSLWFEEAVKVYGWSVPESPAPSHTWDWPAKPQIDDAKTAGARQTDLGTGVKSLRRVYAEDGLDFEDELPAMAQDYGVTVDEMRAVLLKKHFGGGTPEQEPPPSVEDQDQEDQEEMPPARANGVNRIAATNGNGRH